MMSHKEELVDLCPNCGETHIANHPGGRCYVCGEKTKTTTRVRINPKQPHEELVREFQPYFGRLAAQVGLKEARWLEDIFYSDIFDQKQEGKKKIVVFLPTFEQSEKASSSESEDCTGK